MFLVQTIKDNVIEEIFEFTNKTTAHEKFFELCRPFLDDPDSTEMMYFIEQGYCETPQGSICFSNLGSNEPQSDADLIKNAKITTDFSPDLKDDDEVAMEVNVFGTFHYSLAQHGLLKKDIEFGIQDAIDNSRKSIKGGETQGSVALTHVEAVVYED